MSLSTESNSTKNPLARGLGFANVRGRPHRPSAGHQKRVNVEAALSLSFVISAYCSIDVASKDADSLLLQFNRRGGHDTMFTNSLQQIVNRGARGISHVDS